MEQMTKKQTKVLSREAYMWIKSKKPNIGRFRKSALKKAETKQTEFGKWSKNQRKDRILLFGGYSKGQVAVALRSRSAMMWLAKRYCAAAPIISALSVQSRMGGM